MWLSPSSCHRPGVQIPAMSTLAQSLLWELQDTDSRNSNLAALGKQC